MATRVRGCRGGQGAKVGGIGQYVAAVAGQCRTHGVGHPLRLIFGQKDQVKGWGAAQQLAFGALRQRACADHESHGDDRAQHGGKGIHSREVVRRRAVKVKA